MMLVSQALFSQFTGGVRADAPSALPRLAIRLPRAQLTRKLRYPSAAARKSAGAACGRADAQLRPG
jgi:hypothetical protein